MDERWERIERLYNEALSVSPPERAAWLASACAGDDALASEVEGLLRYDAEAERFLERPALVLAAEEVARDRQRLIEGRRLGGYDVIRFLGAGGMGEVYLARDVRLDREVALKIFEKAASPETFQRFDTEARAASRLNHPNIVTIYGVGESGDLAFIVMELVEGETLRDALSAGPLDTERALDIAIQLADAMAAAHACGIVHRDLKPENVMLAAGGRVKVLDFGIATLQRELSAASESGLLLVDFSAPHAGTRAYMSPEQARGEPASPASDQFAIGVMLYEMLTGQRPFEHATRTDSLAAPSASDMPSRRRFGTPAAIAAVLERCMATAPGERYEDSAEMLAALRAVRRELDEKVARSTFTRRQILVVGGLSLLVTASGVATWWSRFAGARRASIAVLPFGNPAGDENTEYLADGLTETLIRQFATLSAVSVTARATAFTFKGTALDPRSIGQRLGVATLLVGSVSRQAGRIAISAELIDASTGARLWGDDYDRPAGDVLAVKNEIAQAIIRDGMHLPITEDEHRRLAQEPTADPAAYELFLLAVHHLRQATEEDYLAARDLLLRAVDRAPGFCLALVTLASTYSVMAVDGYVAPAEAWPQSESIVSKALAVDRDLPDAYAEAASAAFFYRWNWTEAERQWKRALQSPRGQVQSELLEAYALQKWAAGDPESALELARAGRRADPLSGLAAVREADLLAALGRYEDAAPIYTKLIDDRPDDPRAWFGLAEVRRKQGRFQDAIAARREAHAVMADDWIEPVARRASGPEGYAEITRAAARVELERLVARRDRGGYVSPLDLSRAFAQLGNRPEALRHLSAACDERSPGLVLLKVDPAWDSLRSDDRFAAIVARIRIT